MAKYLCDISDPNAVITPIDATIRFPEILDACLEKYAADIDLFRGLIASSDSSPELLDRIRSPKIPSDTRMSLLKMFRRCVSPVLDTETTKKITKVATETLVDAYGSSFKPIATLKDQFANLSTNQQSALAALIGEYDKRGQSGYQLTATFFEWFEVRFAGALTIDGPRGAGKDVELGTVFADFEGSYPCDFVIRRVANQEVLAVGFARYDSTRGGAQSDDRTGGNQYKVSKAKEFCAESGKAFRLLFLADGPGLAHRDTWQEACEIDGSWAGRVRVTTLKLAPERVTAEWLAGET